jgi:hypothetical protein
MIEPINLVGNISNPGSYTSVQDIPAERSGFDGRRDISMTSLNISSTIIRLYLNDMTTTEN